MNVRRVFLAVALQVLLTATLATNIVPTSRILIGIIAAFIAGWWGSIGSKERWIQQGLLIGALVALVWTALALTNTRLELRMALALAYVPGALAGAAVASRDVHIRRAFVAAGIQVIATVPALMVLSFLAVTLLAERGGVLSDADVALYQANALWVSVLLRTSTAFLVGWWAARGGAADTIKYGLLIGVLIILFSWTFVLVLARPLDLYSVVFALPVVGGAVAGVAFARGRTRARLH